MRFRHIYFVALTASLGACNIATSDQPLFAEAQRSPGIVLEDGLWIHVASDCSADVAGPKEKWSKCAGWMVLKGSKVVAGVDMKADEKPQDVFVVDGKPPLIQALVTVKGTDSPGQAAFYGYFVIQPKVRSAAGRVTEVEVWPIPCGTSKPDGNVQPYAGFDKDCRTKSAASLWMAAAKGPTADMPPMMFKWVRAEGR
jgi:hypothetical protein